MAVLTDEALNKKIQAKEIYQVYFLYGEESYLMQNTINLINKTLIPPDFLEFNYHLFDGEIMTLNQLETAYEALPMMAQRKWILVKDWNLEKLPKHDFDKFLSLLKDPNPSTVLILYYPNLSIDPQKSNRFKKGLELIHSIGVSCKFAPKSKAVLKKAIATRCSRQKTPISLEVCEMIIDLCGTNLTILNHEVDKLIYFSDGEPITEQTVRQLSTPSVQSTAFDLSNAILKQQYQTAFSILDQLFYLRIEPIMIIGALTMSFVDLYRVKAAQDVGVSAKQVIQDFQYRSEYRVNKIYQNLHVFSMEQIHNCIRSLEQADRLLKSSKMDARIVLEQMLCQMLFTKHSLPSKDGGMNS